ncbi:MAG TPA: HAD family hydrolase [Terriglobales bacterium]|nr:HAD family hydrolase [Terriglobales bacterium]
MARALVLFDIDGTLVRRAGPHHRQALVDAVRAVTGVETTTDSIPVQGMLDPDILTLMMLNAGMEPAAIREALPEVIERAPEFYLHSVPDIRDKTCPGARELLDELQSREVLLALVTGNLAPIGWRKLQRAGLDGYFRYGAFGEMAKDRAGLAKAAIERARVEHQIAPQTPVSLIGDAPADIIAAKANGIRSIAVCTGLTSREELAAHNPDILVEDLRQIAAEALLR